MTLKSRTFSAVRWTTAGAIVSSLLRVLQIAVLARLLAPEAFGQMALVTVVLGIATVFSDLGLGSAYLQRREVTPEQRSSLYWANVIMSMLLVVLVAGASPLIARFFREPLVVPLLIMSSSTFLISALGQQLRIAAQKKLEFGRVVTLEVLSAIVSFASVVILALLGFGVYALVWGAIVNAITGTALAWIFLSRGWRPAWKVRFEDVKPFLAFGGATVGNGLVNQLNTTIDLLLGGRMLLVSQLGLYSVPRNFMLQIQFMVNPVVTRVGFPLIAEVQHDVDQVRNIYLKTLNMTASINAPLYIGMALFSPEVVTVFLGSKWDGVASVLRILAVWGLMRSLLNPVGSLLLGMGRASLALKWNLALLFVAPPLLIAGSAWGISGLAWALLATQALLFIPAWAILVRPLCQAGFREYLWVLSRPVAMALLATTPAYYLASMLEGAVLSLSLAVVISSVLYVGLAYYLNREWLGLSIQLIGEKNSFRAGGTQ